MKIGGGRYQIIDSVGTGSYSNVYLVKSVSDNLYYAAKRITRKEKMERFIESEIALLRSLEHDCVVKTYAVLDNDSDSDIDIIMEYCNGGSFDVFFSFLDDAGSNNFPRILPEMMVKYFLTQLRNSLEYLYNNNIIHRDLKPANLLLQSKPEFRQKHDKDINDCVYYTCEKNARKKCLRNYICNHYTEFVLKLSDFGFARKLNTSLLAGTICGSPYYMAPEILLGEKYNSRSDLWSVGMILYQCLFGVLPYHKATEHSELIRHIKSHPVRYPFQSFSSSGCNLSPNCIKLLFELLQRNPDNRISWSNFFNHPWFDQQYEVLKSSIDLHNKLNLQQSKVIHTTAVNTKLIIQENYEKQNPPKNREILLNFSMTKQDDIVGKEPHNKIIEIPKSNFNISTAFKPFSVFQ